MIRRPPRSTRVRSSAASDVYKRQGYFRAWADADFLQELGQRDLPVKAFVGATDPAVTVDAVRSSFGKTYPNLELEVLPNVGHYSMYEMPLYLGAKIEEFLMHVVTA